AAAARGGTQPAAADDAQELSP
ncbi:MAG: hypothetical protein JWR62_1162, partial [Modestobacter sp.]|nr:hypothetical protein [Modestobacter sp.]